MGMRDCIGRAAAAGEFSKDRAERILREYDGAFSEFQRSMGHTQADIEAARYVAKKARIEAAEKRRVTQLQAAASLRQAQRMRAHTNIRGDLDPGQYLSDVIANTRGVKGSTLAGRYEAVRRSFRRELTGYVRAFRANLIGGRRKKELLVKFVREAFGEATGDARAAHMAQSWARVSEKARLRFNAAGGRIGKRADWGLPQAHDTNKVRKASFNEWRDFILPKLDLEAMGLELNDGLPFTTEAFETILFDSYQAIRTSGYSRRSPSVNHGSAKYNARSDHRFFKFKSADDWIAYSERFGSASDAFRVTMGHLDSMAMDISMMEELGPNPANGFRLLSDSAKHMAALSGDADALTRANRKAARADDMMDLFVGRSNMPQNEAVAKGASAVRNFLTSAHLGSAVLSSITDFNTQRIAAGFAGFGKLESVRMLSKLARSRAFRDEANDAGLIFENAVDVGNAVARYEMEELHVEAAAKLADFTIRGSGLGWLTEAQRQAHGMVIMNGMAKDMVGKSWADIPARTQRFLQSYGITDLDWATIQKAKIHQTENGMPILRAQEIEEVGGAELADKYMEMIVSSTNFAVPSNNVFARSAVLGRTKPGSLSGEALRFAMQFKSFPVVIIVEQIGRIMAEIHAGRPKSALSYGAGLFLGGTLFGAVALQMKDVVKGKDPRDMTTGKFWAAAIAQGGGLGIFGDFLFADVNRFGGGIAETLAGPGVGFADDILRYTVGNIRQALAGEETQIGRETVQLLRNFTPGGSLWYFRLGYEREVLDQLQRLMDPKAEQNFRRRAQSARTTDTEYFAPPGSSVIGGQGSMRAPNILNAIGE